MPAALVGHAGVEHAVLGRAAVGRLDHARREGPAGVLSRPVRDGHAGRGREIQRAAGGCCRVGDVIWRCVGIRRVGAPHVQRRHSLSIRSDERVFDDVVARIVTGDPRAGHDRVAAVELVERLELRLLLSFEYSGHYLFSFVRFVPYEPIAISHLPQGTRNFGSSGGRAAIHEAQEPLASSAAPTPDGSWLLAAFGYWQVAVTLNAASSRTAARCRLRPCRPRPALRKSAACPRPPGRRHRR